MNQAPLFMSQRPVLEGKWDSLRWYQVAACEAILAGFEEYTRQMLVMCTGGGKTTCFGALARNEKGRVLVLCHRAELVEQARARLEMMTGETVDVEQGPRHASRFSRLVVASLDTIKSPKRLERFGRDHFSLIIFDECQHALAPTYMRPIEFFKAKLLGVTATPDRGDEKAMGKLFENVPYVFDIQQGIEQGYLVPLRGIQVELGEIQLDGVETVAGDLAKGQLDEVMLRAVEGIVSKTIELVPDCYCICFFPGVKSAEYAAERFNALRPGSAAFVSGETDPKVRAGIVADFRDRKIRYLCNCMIFTEGTDLPNADAIVMARPTKSRALYCQAIGRGGRVLGGLVDAVTGEEGAAARRELIAASAKPVCTVLDFVGNATKHALITPVDLLGGDYSDEEVALAKKRAKGSDGANPQDMLREARKELQRVAMAIKSKVAAQARAFDPFAVLDVDITSTTKEDLRWGRQPPTERQLEALARMKLPKDVLAKISQREARKLLAERSRRQDAGLATYAQLGHLAKYGIHDQNLSFAAAGRALTYIATECKWSPGRVDPARLAALTGSK